jgi:hypothetical protein
LHAEKVQLGVEVDKDIARLNFMFNVPKAWAYQQNIMPLQVGDVVAFQLKPTPRREATDGVRHVGRGGSAAEPSWFWHVNELVPVQLQTEPAAAAIKRVQARARLSLGLVVVPGTDSAASAGAGYGVGCTSRPWLYPAELAAFVAAALEEPIAGAGDSASAPMPAAGAAKGPSCAAAAERVQLSETHALLLGVVCHCMELAPPEDLMDQLRASSRSRGVLPSAGSNIGAAFAPAGCIGAYAAILTSSSFFPAFIGVIARSGARHPEHGHQDSSVGALSAALASLRVSATAYRAERDVGEVTGRANPALPADAIVASLVQIAQQVYRHAALQVRHLPTGAANLHCRRDHGRRPQAADLRSHPRSPDNPLQHHHPAVCPR